MCDSAPRRRGIREIQASLLRSEPGVNGHRGSGCADDYSRRTAWARRARSRLADHGVWAGNASTEYVPGAHSVPPPVRMNAAIEQASATELPQRCSPLSSIHGITGTRGHYSTRSTQQRRQMTRGREAAVERQRLGLSEEVSLAAIVSARRVVCRVCTVGRLIR